MSPDPRSRNTHRHDRPRTLSRGDDRPQPYGLRSTTCCCNAMHYARRSGDLSALRACDMAHPGVSAIVPTTLHRGALEPRWFHFCCARTTPTVTALSRWRFDMVGGGMLARSAEWLTCWRKFPPPLTTCGEARLKRRARPKRDGYPSISLARSQGARYPPSTTSEVPVT
jgi:hypothetical protein